MNKIIRKIFFIGLIIFVLMQLYQPARNTDNGQVLPTHFTKVYSVPKNVQTVLQASCYDCHSNNTNYPWYSYIQPIRLLQEHHIEEGKKDLNFSEYGNYSKRKQESKLKSMAKQIKSDEMPISSYTMIHKNAKLSVENKKLLLNWIEKIQDSIAQEY